MRILHVINHLQLGGAEVLLKDLAPSLRDHGVDVEVAVLNTIGSYLEKELTDRGIKVWPMSGASVYSPRHVLPLMRQLRGFDAVHVQLFPAQLWVAFAVRLANKKTPLITTEQSTHNRRRRWWFRPLDRWMYAQYDRIVGVSEPTAAALIQWVPGCRNRVCVIHNALDVRRFSDAKAAGKRDIIGTDDPPIVLFVGRLNPQKDHATLLRAMALVPRAHLVLVGVGELRSELEALTGSLGIGERVHFLGARDDIPALIKMADVYVQSSHWEGWCIAVLEAMAGGLPVIASRAPGLEDAVEGVGRLFPTGNARELAEQINFLLEHPEERTRLAQKGQALAQTFDMELCVKQHIQLYQDVLKTA